MALPTNAQTTLVGTGSAYSSIFSPPSSFTYSNPSAFLGILSLGYDSPSPTGITSSNGIWNLAANGGASISLLGIGLLESQAQTQLAGGTLKFDIDNSAGSLLSHLGVGASIHYSWDADATFNTPGSVLNYSPNTTYHVSFDLNGNAGLLNSVAGVNPTFQFELVDSTGHVLTDTASGTLINVAGLLGTGVPSGTINLDYTLGNTVPTGAIEARFLGDAIVGATAVGLGTDFATVSNLTITASPVPEPAGGLLIASVGMITLLRRRSPRA